MCKTPLKTSFHHDITRKLLALRNWFIYVSAQIWLNMTLNSLSHTKGEMTGSNQAYCKLSCLISCFGFTERCQIFVMLVAKMKFLLFFGNFILISYFENVKSLPFIYGILIKSEIHFWKYFVRCERSQKRRIMNSKIDSLKMRKYFMFFFPAYFVQFVVNIDATFLCHTRRISNNIFSPVQLILSLCVCFFSSWEIVKHSLARSNIFLHCFYLHPPNSLLCLLLSKIWFFVFLFSFVLIVGRCSSDIPLCVFFARFLEFRCRKFEFNLKIQALKISLAIISSR